MIVNHYKPEILDLANSVDAERFNKLVTLHNILVLDTIEVQLSEWIRLSRPSENFTSAQLQDLVVATFKGKPSNEYGNWVYYPWLKTAVHLLPEDEFIEVRTNRNKLKITREEQGLLSKKTIGIIGMSVGQAVAITCAMERIAGEIRIADFDSIELSNLNRIRAGVHQIGYNKAMLAARSIAEMDPYIKVKVVPEGINSSNLDGFLIDNDGKLDALIEVCDSLDIKLKSRLKARVMQIPVIMDTNDRGMIDIERFDLEPRRQLFHGIVPEDELILALNQPQEQRLQTLMKLVSYEHTSEALKKSMLQIGKEIITWPQLASAVHLGAGTACEVLRKILLGNKVPSGRYYIDIDDIIKTA